MSGSVNVSYHADYGRRLKLTIEKVVGKSGADWLEISVRDHRDNLVGEVTVYRADIIETLESVVEAAE